MKIRQVMSTKQRGGDVVTISPEATVRDLLALLAENNIGAVVVSRDGNVVDGIVSERDVVRSLVDGDEVLATKVEQIMTTAVQTVEPDHDLDETRQLMTEGRFRHLPVVDEGRLVGIVSIGDVVKVSIEQIEFERDQLSSYVHQQ